MEFIQNIDTIVIDFIYNNMHTAVLDSVMPLISGVVNKGLLWIFAGIVLAIIPKTRKIGVAVLLAILFEYIIVNLFLKPVFDRPRPYEMNGAVELLVRRLSDGSFPSGHTGVSFAASTAMFLFDKRIGIPALIFAGLVGFSRLYLYVHFPSDVLTGAIIGVIVGILAVVAVRYASEKNSISGRP